jgi:cysteine-rich repeat protein
MPPLPVAAGDPLTGVYRFDPAAQKSMNQAPNDVFYTFDTSAGQFEMHVSLGGLVVSTIPYGDGASAQIVIDDDFSPGTGFPTSDSYDVWVNWVTVPGLYDELMGTILHLGTAKNLSVISGTALPLDPPPLSAFEDNGFSLNAGSLQVTAHLTSFTKSTATEAHGTCGDGIVNPGEECDDYNTKDGDGCDSCRFSCLSSDPSRGCGAGDACNAAPLCYDKLHLCAAAVPKPSFTACGTNLVCWEGKCTTVTAPRSQFATYDFTATVDTPNNEVRAGDIVSGSFTLDLAQPSSTSPTTYDYSNTPSVCTSLTGRSSRCRASPIRLRRAPRWTSTQACTNSR